jgi:hypothetical protein
LSVWGIIIHKFVPVVWESAVVNCRASGKVASSVCFVPYDVATYRKHTQTT